MTSDADFQNEADTLLAQMAEAIDDALGDMVDADIESEILTIDLKGGGQYVINKNNHYQQIWLSSPRSGAWHFARTLDDPRWRSTRDDVVDLKELLADELAAVTGKTIHF